MQRKPIFYRGFQATGNDSLKPISSVGNIEKVGARKARFDNLNFVARYESQRSVFFFY